MTINVCLKCHHTWKQRKAKKPHCCPRCKTYTWDKMIDLIEHPQLNKQEENHEEESVKDSSR